MQVGDTSLWSKDVQRLLWAAGEAHARARRQDDPGSVARRHGAEPPAVADAGFFTEWQPPTGWSRS